LILKRKTNKKSTAQQIKQLSRFLIERNQGQPVHQLPSLTIDWTISIVLFKVD